MALNRYTKYPELDLKDVHVTWRETTKFPLKVSIDNYNHGEKLKKKLNLLEINIIPEERTRYNTEYTLSRMTPEEAATAIENRIKNKLNNSKKRSTKL